MPNEVQKEDLIREIETLFPRSVADQIQDTAIRQLYMESRRILIEKLANSIWLARNEMFDALRSPDKRAGFFRDRIAQSVNDWISAEKRAVIHGRYKVFMESCGKSGTIKERMNFTENDASAFLALETLITKGLKIPALDNTGSRVAFSKEKVALLVDKSSRNKMMVDPERPSRSATTLITGRVQGVNVNCTLTVSIDRSTPQPISPKDIIHIMPSE